MGRALPLAIRGPLTLVAVVAVAFGVTLAVVYSGTGAPGRLDRRAYAAVDRFVPGQGSVIHGVDIIGSPVGAAVAVSMLATVCWILGRRRLTLLAPVSMAAAAVTTTAAKPLVGRTIHGDALSYPSGHTASAAVLAVVTMVLLVDVLDPGALLGTLLFTIGTTTTTAVMAFDQVASRAHYPTDTVGGFCTALAVVPAAGYTIDRIAEHRAYQAAQK